MSDIFALDQQGIDERLSTAASHPVDFNDISPGWFDKTPEAIGMGIARGSALAEKYVGILASAPVVAIEDALGKPGALTDKWYQAIDDTTANAIDYWTPDARTTGAAARVLGQFSEMIPQLAVVGGNPSVMIASQEAGQMADLAARGVSNPVALAGGIVQGASAALGFHIPIMGSTLLTRVGSGIAGNVAAGGVTRGVNHELLTATGYDEIAKDYNVLDPAAMATDALAGIAFGGIQHLSAPKPSTTAKRDAILAALDAKHFQDETAPGHPANVEASVAHQDAMDAAMRAALTGEKFVAPEAVTRAEFVPRESSPRDVPPELAQFDAARAEVQAHEQTRPAPVEIAPKAAAAPEAGPTEPAAPQSPRSESKPAAEPFTDASPQHIAFIDKAARDMAPTVTRAVPTGDVAPDGSIVSAPATELVAKAAEEVAIAEHDAKGFDAAVACFLGSL